MRREIAVRMNSRTVILTLLLIGIVWLTIVLHRVWTLLFLSILLAVGLSGAVNFLEKWRVPRVVSILVLYLLLVFFLIGMGFVLVPLVIQQVNILRVQLPNYIGEPLRQGSALIAERFPELRTSLPTGEFAKQAAEALTGLLGNVGNAAVSLGRATLAVIINFLVVLVMAFFLLSRRDLFSNTVRLMVPTHYQERILSIGEVIGRRLARWVAAQLIIATFYAVCFGTGLALLKIPYALALGVIGGLLELIPYVGGFIATFLTMIVAFTVQPSLALWVLLLHLIVGNIEVHVLAPKVMGRAVETHPVIAILALFSGIELLGIVGALIAIPLAVVGQALIEEFWIRRINTAQPKPATSKPTPEATSTSSTLVP